MPIRSRSSRSSYYCAKRLVVLFLGILCGWFLPLSLGQAADDVVQNSYVLAPNDMVLIKVFQEDDLQSTLRISPKGTIIFPLIGTVGIGGKTPQAAAEMIRDALARDYLVNPQVSVTVAEYGKRRFSVLGQVEKAGTYEMPERETVTLLDAIAMAGGYTKIADPSKITLKRKVGDKETVLRLNAKVMARDASIVAFEIQPGDIVTVGESIF